MSRASTWLKKASGHKNRQGLWVWQPQSGCCGGTGHFCTTKRMRKGTEESLRFRLALADLSWNTAALLCLPPGGDTFQASRCNQLAPGGKTRNLIFPLWLRHTGGSSNHVTLPWAVSQMDVCNTWHGFVKTFTLASKVGKTKETAWHFSKFSAFPFVELTHCHFISHLL